jgi:nucleoside-diphosphate-sugar epimerase
MRFVLFGANGATGRLLTRLVLDAGHAAVAVTRRPNDLPFVHSRRTIASADAHDESAVAEAVDGADAVLSTLGAPFTWQHVDTFSIGTGNIVAAMRHAGVRRLVVTSSTGGYHYPGRRDRPWSLRVFEPIITRTIGKTVYDDTRRMEGIVRSSGLDRTIVRPPILFDLPQRTRYIAGEVEPVGVFTARIDLADYIFALTGDQSTYGKTVVISATEHAPAFWRSIIQQSFKSHGRKPINQEAT